MHLKILGSSSTGNCYILENDKEALMIECGVNFREVKVAVDFDISKIAGCLVSHCHLDHCKYASDVLDACIPVWMSAGSMEAIKFKGHRLPFITEHKHKFNLGGFSIMSFDVEHDAPEPLGFLIHHEDCGNFLFVTDSYYVAWTFPGLNNIMMEINYDSDILNKNLESGSLPVIVKNRVTQSHMSLTTAKEMLMANDLSKVNNIILMHLSNGNSDSRKFKKEIEELTGKNVIIANKGMVVEFNKSGI